MGPLCKYCPQAPVATSYTAAYTDSEAWPTWKQADALFMVGRPWDSVLVAARSKFNNHGRGLLCSITKTQSITLNRSSRTWKSILSSRQRSTTYSKIGPKKTNQIRLGTFTTSTLFTWHCYIRLLSISFSGKSSTRYTFWKWGSGKNVHRQLFQVTAPRVLLEWHSFSGYTVATSRRQRWFIYNWLKLFFF